MTMGTATLERQAVALWEAQSQLYGNLNAALALVEDATRQLPALPDEGILQTREYFQEMEGLAWRVVAACDAQAVSRDMVHGTKGPYLDEYARDARITTRLVRLNAAAYEAFFSERAKSEDVFTYDDVLTDKWFYIVAASYRPNPHKALAHFAQQKTENPHYSVRDAERDADAMRVSRKVAALNDKVSDPRQLGRFPLLYIDPPWRYDTGTTTPDRDIENHYPTLSHEDLCAFPVPAVAQDDAVLFLWATSPKLAEALQVMAAWGFSYRSSLVWVKDRIGMGHWFRSRHELLLLGRRGNFPAPLDDGQQPDSVLFAPRMAHSAKPPEVYALIETMYPTLPRLEMFARGTRAGWVSWGNEIGQEVLS